MALARVLNSVNLPADERALSGIVERSVRSFAGRIADPLRRSYVFVLEGPRRGQVIGTSMVIAQHGTRQSPCTFLDVTERESYSSTLDRHFRHQVLSIGFHFDGPTEIGGLVVDPRWRGGPELPGKQLSLVRFLYMATFPDRFRDTVLAELMPPLAKDGKSLFWESFGRRFTGLDYQDADKRSRRGKEFIQQLFPGGEFYATLLRPGSRRRSARWVGAPRGRGGCWPASASATSTASTPSTAVRTTRRSSRRSRWCAGTGGSRWRRSRSRPGGAIRRCWPAWSGRRGRTGSARFERARGWLAGGCGSPPRQAGLSA